MVGMRFDWGSGDRRVSGWGEMKLKRSCGEVVLSCEIRISRIAISNRILLDLNFFRFDTFGLFEIKVIVDVANDIARISFD